MISIRVSLAVLFKSKTECRTDDYLTRLDQKSWSVKTALGFIVSIIGYSYIANFGEMNENAFKKNSQILLYHIQF